MKDLIKDEIQDEIQSWRRKINHSPNYQELIEFYKCSNYLSKPYKIFENKFKLFWMDIKDYFPNKHLPLKSSFDTEAYLKVQLFSQCISIFRAEDLFNQNKFDQEELTWLMIGRVFYVPKLLLAVVSGQLKNDVFEWQKRAMILLQDSLLPVNKTEATGEKDELHNKIKRAKHILEQKKKKVTQNNIAAELGLANGTTLASQLKANGLPPWKILSKSL